MGNIKILMSYFYPLPPPQIPLVTVETARRAKLLIDDTQTSPHRADAKMDRYMQITHLYHSISFCSQKEMRMGSFYQIHSYLQRSFRLFESRTKNSVLLYMEEV